MLGIWRHIVVGQFPSVHPRAHLVLQVRGRRTELGTYALAVLLHDPSGALLIEQSGTMQVNEPPAGVVDLESPAILVFDLPLPMAGEYAFVVHLDGSEVARVPFKVSATQ
ncbi:MAG: hypothetical protein H0W15_04605 [Gemmatimonadales bacterium]|nr:hypothetical protein [Gemmatimonadales bacterium]